MSKEDDERQKQEHNDAARANGDRLRRIGREKQDLYDRKAKKLARLKQAKKELTGELTQFEALERHMSGYAGKVSPHEFKGSLKNQFDQKMSTMTNNVRAERQAYQQAEATIDAKITVLEVSQGDLLGAINNAFAAAEDWFSSII